MDTYQAVILGIIQGLTEFLPVSSSGHLVLGQHIFGLKAPALLFDVSVHMGTLAAVLLVFYKEIFAISAALGRFGYATLTSGKNGRAMIVQDTNLKMALLIVIGSIPTAILGLMFHNIADRLFSSMLLVGCMLLITGSFLWGTRLFHTTGDVETKSLSPVKSLVIGLVQGMAVMPGISRSGSTIVTGLFLGLDREVAARYSFLLSIPAIIGAEGLALKSSLATGIRPDTPMLLGTLSAFVVGYLALILLLKIVRQGQLYLFAPYCWIVGGAAVIADFL